MSTLLPQRHSNPGPLLHPSLQPLDCCNHLLTGLLLPASAPSSPPPTPAARGPLLRHSPDSDTSFLRNLQWLLIAYLAASTLSLVFKGLLDLDSSSLSKLISFSTPTLSFTLTKQNDSRFPECSPCLCSYYFFCLDCPSHSISRSEIFLLFETWHRCHPAIKPSLFSQLEVVFIALCGSPWFPPLRDQGCCGTHLWALGWGTVTS